ncbi:MAG: DsrE/DsrF/DrsH-like family protein [Methanomassiliicoccales archaeon]|nr:MAG: DsrE/DsrF/DrsH-like family protein [Methanomassiliicoccales archaeon]
MAKEGPKKVSMVVAEGSFDKAMMPFIVGTTAASMGMEVHIFFTFFGLQLLKKGTKPKLPGMMRFFTGMILKKMKKLKIPDFEEMKTQAIDLGVHLYACSTSMTIMNIKKEDLIDGAEILGAAAFLDIAADSEVQLFIG